LRQTGSSRRPSWALAIATYWLKGPSVLSEGVVLTWIGRLRRRFILLGFINALLAPFIVVYLLFYSFFRYFEEYHKNPASIGSRSFTELAKWRFREYNELEHFFKQRLNQAHQPAQNYLDQFPKERTALVSRYVA
jgi:autophagy-related protein 9